jgi:hypothetical protein
MVEVEGRLWAAIEPDDPARPFTAERVPLGANMALKREAHLRFPFDTRIGPRPKGEIRGEETRLFRQLMDAGEVGYWVPDARVKHLVPVERQSLSYVRRFFFGLGQTFYILYEGRKGDIMGRPPWAWFQAVRAELLFQTWRWTGRPERWLRHLMDASFAWGFLWGDRSGGSVEP